MKKIISVILALIMVLTALPLVSVSSYAEDEVVYEVHTWEELDAAFRTANYDGAEYTVRLMNNLYFSAIDTARTATYVKMTEIFGGIVTFDFNGHTLSCTDTVSETDLDYCLSDFLRIDLHQIDADTGSVLRFTDSVGGGGVSMISKRGKDSQLAALHVAHNKWYKKFGYPQSSSKCDNVVIFDGGTYTLTASCTKFGRGTLNRENAYRGTVIVDEVQATVNGGTFIAQGDGTGVDECYRELSALATACSVTNPSGIFSSTKLDFIPNCYAGSLVINGGLFQSVGYSVHHFDKGNSSGYSGPTVNSTGCMLFPKIYGGTFIGRMGFVGMTFTYNDGYSDFREKAASDIIKASANTVIKGKKQNNSSINGLDGLTLGDLHNVKTFYIANEDLFKFSTSPVASSFPAALERDTSQSDTFEAFYDIPWYLNGMPVATQIKFIANGGATQTVNSDSCTVNYSDYPNGLTVNIKTTFTFGGEDIVSERTYNISVTDAPQAANIISKPVSMTVEPGEWAQASVVADHATDYKWQVNFNGAWFNVEQIVSMFTNENTAIEGYNTPTLRVMVNGLSAEKFRCRVTGTDGTVTTVPNSSGITLSFGRKPTVSSFRGGEFITGEDATFSLKAKYLDASNANTVVWYVADRSGGSLEIKTVDDFCTEKGLTYEKKTLPKLNSATITFHGVTSAKVNKCSVCYRLENRINTVDVNPESDLGCLPFKQYKMYGYITSYWNNTDDITVQLIPSGNTEAAYETVTIGNSARYTFSDVDAGAYTLRTIKNCHVIDEQEITVNTATVSRDIELKLSCDINGDHDITIDDYSAIKGYLGGNGLTLTAEQITVADFNHDEAIDAFDVFYADRMLNRVI